MFFGKKGNWGVVGKGRNPRSRQVQIRSWRRTHLIEQLEPRQLLAVAPVTRDDPSYYTPVNTNLVITTSSAQTHLLANDLDFDGGSQIVSIVTNPAHGTILSSGNDGAFTYQPDSNFSGYDRFEYRINDGTQDSNVAQVIVAVGGKLLGESNQSSIGRTSGKGSDPLEAAGEGQTPFLRQQGFDTNELTNGVLTLNERLLPEIDLVYRTDAVTRKPIVMLDTALIPGAGVPDELTAKLTLGGVAGTTYDYDVSSLTAGQSLHFALQADATSLATGMHDYSVLVRTRYGSTWTEHTFNGQQAVVDRSASEFGSGWWLAGVDRLVTSSTGALLVRGNGDSLWFAKNGANYDRAEGDLSFATLVKNGNNTYTLTTKHGVQQNFSTIGLLTSVVDLNGNTVTYAYSDTDSSGVADNLTSITDPFSRSTSINYTSGKVSSIAHFSGRTAILAVSSNKLTSLTLPDPDGGGSLAAPVTQFAYSSTHQQLTSRTDPLNYATTFSYNATDLRLRTLTYPDANSKAIVPLETHGLPTSTTGSAIKKTHEIQGTVTDERGKIWKFRVDRFGQTVSWVTPLGFETLYTRDHDGQVLIHQLPDPDGSSGPKSVAVTNYGYNSLGDLVYQQFMDNSNKSWTYSTTLHQALSATDEVGRTQSSTYDANGNRLTSTDGGGFVTTYANNSRGQPTSITQPDPDGSGSQSAPVTTLAYNSNGRLVTLTNPDASTRTFTYNSADQQLTETDELNHTATTDYDSLGRVTGQTDRVGAETEYVYDAASQVTRVTDALGNETDSTFNSRGWVTTIAYPDPDGSGPITRPSATRAYDAAGNHIGAGQISGFQYGQFEAGVTHTFDDDGRLTKKSEPGVNANFESYLYDDQGNVTRFSDFMYDENRYTYNDRGWMTGFQRVFGSNAQTTNMPNGSYTYTAAGEKLTVTDARGNVTTYGYNSRGLPSSTTLPDPDGDGSQFGRMITHSYDNIGREIQTNSGYGPITSLAYNSRGWVTTFTDADPDEAGSLAAPTTIFGYDVAGRNTTVTDPLSRVTALVYDHEGRLTSITAPDPDGTGSLTSPVTSRSYDMLGRVTSVTDPRGGVSSTTYDHLDRVLTVTQADPDGTGSLSAPVSTNTYNSSGLWKTTDPMGHVTEYSRDGQGRTTGVTDPLGNTTNFTYNYFGLLLTQTDPDPDGSGSQTRSVTTNAYDSAKRLTTKTDSLSGATDYTYDPAGNMTSLRDPVNNTTSFGYDGQNQLVLETNSLSKSRSFVFDVGGNLARKVDRNGRVTQYVTDGLGRLTDEQWREDTNPSPSLSVSTTQSGGAIDEQQTVGWTANMSVSGTYTLSLNGQTTSALAANATAAQIQSALEGLSTIGSGNVLVESVAATYGSYNKSFKLTYRGTKAATNVAQTTINVSSLTQSYGGSPTAVNTTTTQGGVYSETQSLVLSNAAGGTFRLAYEGVVTKAMSASATAAEVECELEGMLAIDDITVTGSNGTFTVAFGGTHTNTNVSQIFGDAAHSSSGTIDRSIETSYNAASEVTSISDPDATIAYTRDNLGRATTITNTIAGLTPTVVLNQSFDVASNRTWVSATLGGTADFANTYQYDALQRLTDIVQQSQSGGNSVTAKHVTFAYNGLGQSTALTRYQSTGSTNHVATSTATYDTANRLSSLNHAQGSTALAGYAYTYDAMSRPTSIDSAIDGVSNYTYDATNQLTGADHTSQTDEVYGFDANGNRNTTDYATGGNNQTSESPGYSYTYDDEGNRLTRTSTATGDVEHYTWDQRNRLIKVLTTNEYDDS